MHIRHWRGSGLVRSRSRRTIDLAHAAASTHASRSPGTPPFCGRARDLCAGATLAGPTSRLPLDATGAIACDDREMPPTLWRVTFMTPQENELLQKFLAQLAQAPVSVKDPASPSWAGAGAHQPKRWRTSPSTTTRATAIRRDSKRLTTRTSMTIGVMPSRRNSLQPTTRTPASTETTTAATIRPGPEEYLRSVGCVSVSGVNANEP
jgi:hypothetical protein